MESPWKVRLAGQELKTLSAVVLANRKKRLKFYLYTGKYRNFIGFIGKLIALAPLSKKQGLSFLSEEFVQKSHDVFKKVVLNCCFNYKISETEVETFRIQFFDIRR